MRDISSIKHYKLNVNPDGTVVIPNVNLKPTDVCLFPMSFNRDILENNYRKLFKYVKKGVVLNLSFDVTRVHSMSYDEWKFLIAFARTHNINFKVNEFEEYTPNDLESYINKFSVVRNGKREFAFQAGHYWTKNNVLIEGRENDESILEDKDAQEVIYTDTKGLKLNRYIRTVKYAYNNKIVFDLRPNKEFSEYVKEDVIRIINYIKKHYKNDKFDFCFSCACQYYNKEEFSKILEIEEYIKNNYDENYELKFSGAGKIYSKSQIINVNDKIGSIVNTLKKSKASPYEKIIYVHKLLSELDYIKAENSNLSRNIYSVLNTRNIICVGYASLFNAIFEELNDENIKVRMDLIKEIDGNGEPSYHSINCVYLKDDKYDIEGYYNLDSCHNSKTDNLRNFMMPIKDFEYSYANRSRSVNKMLFAPRGTLMAHTYCFDKNAQEANENTVGVREGNERIIMDSTLEFLDTNLGRTVQKDLGITRVLKKNQVYDIIDKCVERSEPIFMGKTYDALINVSKKFYNMSNFDSICYSKSLISRTCFESLFLFKRKECVNDFARVSLAIENDLIKVNSNKSIAKKQ